MSRGRGRSEQRERSPGQRQAAAAAELRTSQKKEADLFVDPMFLLGLFGIIF